MSRQKMPEREDLSSLLASLTKGELVDITGKLLSDFLSKIKEKYRIEEEDLFKLIKKEIAREKEYWIPISIFDNKELSALETVVKYLKENLKLRYKEIAVILNRDERNIWTTYRNAKAKRGPGLVLEKSEFFVPAKIFQDRKLSVLENLTSYLKETYKLTYRKISKLLNRNERTIWTAYHRARVKYEGG